MKKILKRIYVWAHTPTGDGILCGLAYLFALIVAWGAMWALYFLGF